MKILLLDIETAPNLGYVWDLFNQNISPKQVVEGRYLLSWAAKWYGSKEILFDSIHKSSLKAVLHSMHKLMDEADAIVTYYGSRFDVPVLNTEFIKFGLKPPSPSKNIDLKKVSSEVFKFPSNKLEYVVKALGLGSKLDTDFSLWIGCMRDDATAWRKMERYNRHDVRLLERLYVRYLPWIKNHPNQGAYGDNKEVCPNCGKTHFHRRGYAIANLLKYPKMVCLECGKWFRSNVAINKKEKRYVTI